MRTFEKILKSKNPGKLIKKEMLSFHGNFLNLEKSENNFVDPITFMQSLFSSEITDQFLDKISYRSSREVFPLDYKYNFNAYVKNRDKSDSKLLWKLALALYKGKKWKKLFKKAYKNVYAVDIECLSGLAYFMNPKKFKFINKYKRLSSNYSLKEYLLENK